MNHSQILHMNNVDDILGIWLTISLFCKFLFNIRPRTKGIKLFYYNQAIIVKIMGFEILLPNIFEKITN